MLMTLCSIFCFNLSSFAIGSITGTATVCAGDSTLLADATSGGVWTTSDPTVATINSATGMLYGVGTGTVTVQYTIPGVDSTTTTINVLDVPVAGLISGGPTICVGTTIVMSDTSVTGFWAASNTNVSINSIGEASGNMSGNDSIWYIVTNGCGSDTAVNVVTVLSAPKPNSILGPDTICVRSTVALADSEAGGAWAVTNTNAAITTLGNITGARVGMDTVLYVITNACGTDTSTLVTTIMNTPRTSPITVTPPTGPGPVAVCVGANIQLADSIAGGTWNTTATNVTLSATGEVTGLTQGRATILYTTSNFCGSSNARLNVIVDSLPDPGTVTGPATLCVNQMVTYTDASLLPFGELVTWYESVGNIQPGSANGQYIAFTPGPDTVLVIVQNNCGIDTAFMPVVVNPLPSAGTISGYDTVCVGTSVILSDTTSTGGIWTTTNSNAAVTGSGIVEGIDTGSVTVMLIAANSCGVDTAQWPMYVLPTGCVRTAVNNVYAPHTGIEIFPNPAYYTFNIMIYGNLEAAITVTDVMGNAVARYTAANTQREVTIDASKFAAGTYMVRVSEGENVYREKLVIIQ